MLQIGRYVGYRADRVALRHDNAWDMTRTALSIPILLVVLFAATAALFNTTAVPSGVDSIAAVLPMPAAPISRRCPQCGWIESKREILAMVKDPAARAIYEYTVRMGDGTSSVFREELPVSWRLGERLIVIEGMK
jgi:hypothetical protein